MQSTKSPNPEAPVKFCRLAGRSACVHAKMIQMLCIQRNNLYQFMAFHTNYRNILEAYGESLQLIVQHFDRAKFKRDTASSLRSVSTSADHVSIRWNIWRGSAQHPWKPWMGFSLCRAVPGEKPPFFWHQNQERHEPRCSKMLQAYLFL